MNIQEIQLNQVSQIYLGKDRVCRCGCKGKYISTSFMESARNSVNDKLANIRLKRAKKLALDNNSEVTYCGNNINVSYGDNKAITIYLDELK
jgi:hypothetical protein